MKIKTKLKLGSNFVEESTFKILLIGLEIFLPPGIQLLKLLWHANNIKKHPELIVS